MPATQLENVLLGSRPNDVDYAGGILFLIKGLQNHIVALLLLILDQLILMLFVLDHEWIGRLANFALKSFPKEA